MRKLFLICFMMIGLNSFAQEFSGFSLAYSTKNVVGMDLMFSDGDSLLNTGGDWHIGFATQQNGQHGSRRNAGTRNYGRTSQGGDFFFTVLDLGYSKVFNNIRVHLGGSIGENKNYTNYSDLRFTTGGYYDINYKESITGVELNVGYIWDSFEFFAGYGNIKGANFGMRLTL